MSKPPPAAARHSATEMPATTRRRRATSRGASGLSSSSTRPGGRSRSRRPPRRPAGRSAPAIIRTRSCSPFVFGDCAATVGGRAGWGAAWPAVRQPTTPPGRSGAFGIAVAHPHSRGEARSAVPARVGRLSSQKAKANRHNDDGELDQSGSFKFFSRPRGGEKKKRRKIALRAKLQRETMAV